MVQNSIRRDYYNPRDVNARSSFHSQDSRNPDFITDDRYNLKPQPPPPQAPVHPHPLSIEAALRECAGVSVRAFALCVVDANNEERFYTSENLTRHQQQIFSERFKVDVRKALRRGSLRSLPFSVPHEDDYDCHQQSFSGGSSSEGRQRRYIKESRSEDSEEDPTIRRRKRSRPSLYTDDDTPAPVPVQKTMPLVISDEIEVNKFYEQRFKDMQQSSCKVMGKAFVKLVEPKKQTHHPYTKGDDMAPDWWPINGDANERVKHREPDHLLKPERIRLLVHILKMAVEPVHLQHASAAKVGLNVKKLEEAALEVMVPWFNDKDHPENAAKRTFFREIFKVAKQEERYKNGEIDGTTRVHVMIGDRAGMDNSEDDDDDDEEGTREDDMNENHTPTSSAAPSITDMVSSSINQTQHPPQPLHPEPEIPYRIQPTVRYTSRPPMDDHPPYADSSFMPRTVQNAAYQPMSPSPLQEANRRFYSPGHASPQQMYGWGQTNMVNHSAPNYFVNSPQHGLLTTHSAPYLPPPPPQGPLTMLPPPMPPMPHHYDLQNSPRYDTGSPMGQPLRSGSIGHSQSHNVIHGQNYTDYIHEPGPPVHHNADMKVDGNTDLYDE